MITKNSKICFIHPPQPESLDDRLDIPLGLLYIASSFKKQGFKKVRVIDFSGYDEDVWDDLMPEADVYGFQTYTTSYPITLNLCDIARKKNSKALMIAGGAHASTLSWETLSDGFDIVVVGDGELLATEGINYINQGAEGIFHFEVKNLDELPEPDISLCDTNYSRIVDGKRALSFITSRGCAYQCAFCCSKGTKFRNINNCYQELKKLKEKYPEKNFIFYDDNFVIYRQRCFSLCEKIEDLDIRFRCNSHCNQVESKIYKTLYRAGCRLVCFGVESGNEELRKKMKKKIWNEEIKESFQAAKDAGLITKAFLIVGFPGETEKTIEETIKLMQEVKPDQYTVFNFVPLPGSDTWNYPEKYGIIELSKDYRQYYNIAGQNEGGISFVSKTVTPEKMISYRKMLLSGLKELEWRGDKQDYQRVAE